ncbi:MAG: hypothetical protein NVSMB24_00210 [Mucilaginibacter sp.]
MITIIKLDLAAGNVTLQFNFATPQQFFYTWKVGDPTGEISQTGQGQWDGLTSFDLGSPVALIGNYLSIDWTVLDPSGAGNIFHAIATATQGGASLPVDQVTGGNTTATSVYTTTIAKFA